MKKTSSVSTRRRMLFTLIAFMVLGFGVICVQLFYLTIIQGEHLQHLAMQQQTRANVLGARRGVIYDRNMNPLAESATVWNICISPAEIDRERLPEISTRLAEILEIDRQVILDAAERTNLFYWVIARGVDRTVVDEVLEFIRDYQIGNGVFTEQTTRRYYRYGRLASTVLGFTNTDGDGAYGIEAYYNRILSGVPGRVVSTRDAKGHDMPFMYSHLYAAQDGNSIVLTIDRPSSIFWSATSRPPLSSTASATEPPGL